jgi:hypothetical protein
MFQVTSRRAGQQKAQLEAEYIPDPRNGYEEYTAREEAQAFFDNLHASHSGGTTEYVMLQCTELANEVRPIV